MTLPPFLWGAGAAAVGNYNPIDRVRCSQCNRWTNSPSWYGPPNLGPAAVSELERVLCHRHQTERAAIAYQWLTEVTK